MSVTEASSFSLGAAAPTRRANKALAELAELAGSGQVEASEAADLLKFLVALLAQRPAAATMPKPERDEWEALGAKFSSRDIVSRAHLRARAVLGELISQCVPGDAAVAALLEVDRSRISQRVGERSLYSFVAGDTRYFPHWQFEGRNTIPHLRRVLAALPSDLHPVVVTHWFTTPNLELVVDESGRASPRDWLVTGGPPEVVVELAVDA